MPSSIRKGGQYSYFRGKYSSLDGVMSVLSLDEKSRVVLNKNVREVSGMKKGSKLVAIPFKGGVMLVDVTGKNFVGNMSGFAYQEREHEASKLLFRKTENEAKRKK